MQFHPLPTSPFKYKAQGGGALKCIRIASLSAVGEGWGEEGVPPPLTKGRIEVGWDFGFWIL